ncbi:MAG: outer membrane protein assembly factor BamE [Alphaproteobacteria bacterium]|nr:outer membrane protein assembly factor BamE [Alphaproteobacteria bacterium]
MQKMNKIMVLMLCSAILCACAPVVAQRGNLLEDHQLQNVTAGQSTRSDVLRFFGSPTAQSTFNNDVWYYMGQTTEKRGILDETVEEERVIVVEFDQDGLVKSITEQDSERLDIPYARAQTPTHGNDLTFMQQLLGNLGRFNAPQASATDL